MSEGVAARFRILYAGFCLDVDLALPGRGVSALFGPSGSGKTTCLRAIAGLERAAGGFLTVNGDVWQDDASGIFIATHRRPVGYVFQEADLFPHLSVRKNLEYGWKRLPIKERRVHFDHVVELLGLDQFLERLPAKLSGGERQRVAIARSLLCSPRILLMDEPLAALDMSRKQEFLPYLKRLHDELDIPLLYVSHSLDEVMRLADHLVLMSAGTALASGPLAETLVRLDLPTALTDHAGIIVEGRIDEHDSRYHLTKLSFAGGSLLVAHRPEPVGTLLRVHILARDVSIALSERHDTSILNRLNATIVAAVDSDTPAHVVLQLNAGGTPLLARISKRSRDQLGLLPGRQVWAQIKTVALLA